MREGNVAHGLPGSTEGVVSVIATAAHELKAPLALIRQLSLAIETGDYSKKDVEKMARQVSLVSERALRLTTGLTKASKMQGILCDLEPIDPNAVCEEVVQELLPLYQASGRTLRASIRTKSVLALGNRDLLRRIIINFADNALHYANSDAPVSLSARSLNSGAHIRILVRDYGPGLAKNFAPQPTRPESSGLGLIVARQFAEAMNAQIGAIRHRDGASFYVDLMSSSQMRLF